MIMWEVESWDTSTETIERYNASTHEWGDFTNILKVTLPHSINGERYTMVQVGSDWYYRESTTVFIGWVDPSQPWATDVVGHRVIFDNGVVNEKLYEVPSVQGAIPGIMIPDDLWSVYRRGELSYG